MTFLWPKRKKKFNLNDAFSFVGGAIFSLRFVRCFRCVHFKITFCWEENLLKQQKKVSNVLIRCCLTLFRCLDHILLVGWASFLPIIISVNSFVWEKYSRPLVWFCRLTNFFLSILVRAKLSFFFVFSN